jgi:hypothetical protein
MVVHKELTKEKTIFREFIKIDEMTLSRLILFLAFLGGTVLRVWMINAMGYNTDEAVYSGQAAAIAGVPVLEDIFPIFRAHPLLFQVLLSIVYQFQFSDLAGRLFAVAIGLGTIFLTFQTGKLLYGRIPGALAALFIALMPYHVLVTRQVLLDGPMVFFATLSLYFLVQFGYSQKSIWIYFTGASMGLTFLAKETSIILMGAIYSFLALASDIKIRIRDVIISIFLWILVILPFPVSIALAGSSTTGRNYLAWQLFRRPNHDWSFYFNNVPPSIGILLIAAAIIGVILLWKHRSWKEKLLLCWILIPLTFFQIWPVKGFQYLLPIAPPLAILAGRLLGKLATESDTISLSPFFAKFSYYRLASWVVTGVIVLSLFGTSWQRIQPEISTRFMAGTGGVPGGREAGEWVKNNAPLNSTFMTIGPSMANIIKFYGQRPAYGLSVSPNPLHRNPAYTPINNPDAQIRRSEIQYIIWDSFSASRSTFFSDKLMGYVKLYNGRAIHTESITVTDTDGKPVVQPIIIIYEVHP